MIKEIAGIIDDFHKGVSPSGYNYEITKDLNSSYKKNNYGAFFYALGHLDLFDFYEIGVLEGYALINYALGNYFATSKITGIDLFEDYEFNSCSHSKVSEQLIRCGVSKKITLIKSNGLTYLKQNEGKIDKVRSGLHLDVSNHGQIIEEFAPYISKFSAIIFEGGSNARDKVAWMEKYNKSSLRSALYSFSETYGFNMINLKPFPSLTLCFKQ